MYDFVQWLTRNHSPGAIIKIYIEDAVVEKRTAFIPPHETIAGVGEMIFQPDVSEATALREMDEKVYIEMKGVGKNKNAFYCQQLKVILSLSF